MRTLSPFLFAGLLLILSACNSVVFPEPLGKPLPAAEVDKLLIGDWIGNKGSIWKVERESGSEYLNAIINHDAEQEKYRFLVRNIGKETIVLWIETKSAGSYTPLRVSSADDTLALLVPDNDAVRKLVSEGKLQGKYDNKSHDHDWIIAKGDWEGVLAGKDFWLLDHCLPFVRRPAIFQQSKTSVPPASDSIAR